MMRRTLASGDEIMRWTKDILSKLQAMPSAASREVDTPISERVAVMQVVGD